MRINRLDHFDLFVVSIQTTCEFYSRVLGMSVVTFGQGRKALVFGGQKINPHEVSREFESKAHGPTAGFADFCLVTDMPIEEVVKHLEACRVLMIEGPVIRTGTTATIRSIYLRDSAKSDRVV